MLIRAIYINNLFTQRRFPSTTNVTNELDLSEAKLLICNVVINFNVSDMHLNIVLCDTFIYD